LIYSASYIPTLRVLTPGIFKTRILETNIELITWSSDVVSKSSNNNNKLISWAVKCDGISQGVYRLDTSDISHTSSCTLARWYVVWGVSEEHCHTCYCWEQASANTKARGCFALHFINTSLNGRLLWVCSQSSAGGSALIRGMECMVHITTVSSSVKLHKSRSW
jgi:hypothetical protein